MIVLGLNAFGHDAAAVLMVDGAVVYAASEERLDRKRHSTAFPRRAIAAALAHADLPMGAIDRIAFPWTRGMGRWPKALHVARGWPRSRAYLREPADDRVADRRGYLRAMRGLATTLRQGGLRAPLVRVPHHLAHAASARLALPDGDGVVITADGMGEWTTAALWSASGPTLRRHARATYPDSPGKTYAAVTAWLGFRPESHEGKTMGLAAYGDPASERAAFARGLMTYDPRRLVRVNRQALGFPWGEARLYGDAFEQALGPARAAEEPLRPYDADVARGMQDAAEAWALEAARAALAHSPGAALGLAGGLFLNCALNGYLARTLDTTVAPFPVAGDAGAAWGAAAYVHRQATRSPPAPLRTLRLGHEITDGEARAVLALHALTAEDYSASPDALGAAVAARVRAGHIVGVARGRAELGPRALGGRSILAWPTARAVRDEVNRRKGREAWRPLAPIVREGDTRWFHDLTPSPHMILTFRATDEARRAVPGILHEDGTARVQTVGPNDDALVRVVLDALATAGGPDVLLNTSLNRPGEPIVNTAAEALEAAQAMSLDALVLGDHLLDLTGGAAPQST